MQSEVAENPLSMRDLELPCNKQLYPILPINPSVSLAKVSCLYCPEVARDLSFQHMRPSNVILT
jgi:hypothetical protein